MNPQTTSEVEAEAIPATDNTNTPKTPDSTASIPSPQPTVNDPIQQPQTDAIQPATVSSATNQSTDTLQATDQPAATSATDIAVPTATDQPAATPDINISTDGQLSMQSEAEEQASVDQQINNFVGNNASDQTQSSAAPQTTPPNPANDQTLANAVDNLSNQSQPTPTDNISSTDSPSITTTHHQKIIKPMDDVTPPKKTLDELLAQEETKSNQNDNPKPENNFNPDDPNNIAL